jgi:hypothetical protein
MKLKAFTITEALVVILLSSLLLLACLVLTDTQFRLFMQQEQQSQTATATWIMIDQLDTDVSMADHVTLADLTRLQLTMPDSSTITYLCVGDSMLRVDAVKQFITRIALPDASMHMLPSLDTTAYPATLAIRLTWFDPQYDTLQYLLVKHYSIMQLNRAYATHH